MMSTTQLKANIKHEKYLLNAAYDALHKKQTAKKKPHKTNKAKSTSFVAILSKSKSFNKNLDTELTQSKINLADLDNFNEMFN